MDQLISIVIPVYNKRETLLRCIQSIEKNDGVNYEIVLVDDGSTDGSHEILETIEDKYTVIRQENAGPAVARNRGARNAKGDILLFIDADDALAVDALDTHTKAFSHQSVDVSIGGTVIEENDVKEQVVPFEWFEAVPDQKGIRIVDRFFTRLIKGITVGCVATRKESFWRAGGFDGSLRCWEISEFLLRLLLDANEVALSQKITAYKYENASNSQFVRTRANRDYAVRVALSMMSALPRVPKSERKDLLALISSFLHRLISGGSIMKYKELTKELKDEPEFLMHLGKKERLVMATPDWLLRRISR